MDIWREQHLEVKKYSRQQKIPRCLSRIDFILVSQNIANNCTTSDIIPGISSDHSIVVLQLQETNFSKGRGYWKLNTSLLRDAEYIALIKSTISEQIDMNKDKGIPPDVLWDTIKCVIAGISVEFSTRKKKENSKMKSEIQERMEKLYLETNNFNCHPEVFEEFERTRAELDTILEREAKGAIVRSKVKWVEHGEKCTKYFCSLEKGNFLKKNISRLRGSDGTIISSPEEIMGEAHRFYQGLYSTSFTDDRDTEIDDFLRDLELPRLEEEQKREIETPVTKEECFESLKSMECNKSPGHDGLPAEFYRVFWVDIADLLMEVYNYSFTQGELPISQRRGIISLIPKKDRDGLLIKNYRPITLLSVDYKIIAKCIATRLKTVLDSLIHTDQSGFLKGRHIGSNIRSTIDILQYTTDNKLPGAILLLDIEKAFDSLERAFMMKTLERFNFGDNILQWVHTFYAERTSRIMNYGHLSEPVDLERGVFQGCPLSPYIFLIAIETFATALRQNRTFQGIKIGNREKRISLYADDAIVFTRGDDLSLSSLFDLLDIFGRVSGCKTNMSKTKAIWIGINKGDQRKPFENKGIQWCADRFTCLGVEIPLNLDDLFRLNLPPKLEKVCHSIEMWKARNLSLVGKITVVKSLLLPQFLYMFTVLPVDIPQHFFKKVESVLYSFIWNTKKDKVKRKTMTCDYEDGGLNMAHVESFFRAQQIHWVKLLLDVNYDDIWKDIELEALRSFDDDPFLLFKCNPSRKTLNSIKYKSIITSVCSWNKYKNCCLEFRDQSLWYNSLFRSGNLRKRDLYQKTWHEKGILYVRDIMVEDRLMFFEELALLYDLPERDRRVFDKIANIIALADNINNVQDDEKLTNAELLDNILRQKATKHTYKIMVKSISEPPVAAFEKWEKDMGEQFTPENWKKINQSNMFCTIETKLRAFYFKFLHRIAANNEFLSSVNIIESDLCTFCQEHVETLYHYLCSCPLTVIFWTEVLAWIKTKTNIELELVPSALLFGRNIKSECVLYIVLYAKYFIYLSRLKNQTPMFNLFLVQLQSQYKIEYKIAENNNSLNAFLKKWSFEI